MTSLSKALASGLLALATVLSTPAAASPPGPLPALNIDIRETSVSGISSGGFMSAQLQVAHSSIIKGAGIVAGGPYYCAQNDVITATTLCSCTGEPMLGCKVTEHSAAVQALVTATQGFFAKGLIDDPANIARQRVATVVGGEDRLVPTPIARQLHDYYGAFGLPPDSLKAIALDGAGHTMPTIDFGAACATTDEPYIGKCDFDAAGAILGWIYPDAVPPAPAGTPAAGRFVEFDQSGYVPKGGLFDFLWGSGMDKTGWVYVPQVCEAGERCRLHIALHGCKQGQSYLPLKRPPGGGLYNGTTFVKNTGYDRWADANRLVVLFPQAVSIPWRNPNGCWDWWGYTDEHYATRNGVQIRALRAMIDRLGAGLRPGS